MELSAELYFHLGTTSLKWKKLNEDILAYNKSLQINKALTDENHFAVTYHQIGSVYLEQRKWQPALENFQKALDWYKKTEMKLN